MFSRFPNRANNFKKNLLVKGMKVKGLATQSCLTFQDPLSMEFSRQEYWSGQPFPSPGDLPEPGIEPGSPPLQADSLLSHQGIPKGMLELNIF